MTVITIRLEDELLDALKKLADLEHLDRTNLIKKLLRKITKEELLENVLQLYTKGQATLEQASELANVPPWEVIDMMALRGIQHKGSPEELRADVRRRLEEIGLKKLADEI
jgi:predicted HTH domain antitoxin